MATLGDHHRQYNNRLRDLIAGTQTFETTKLDVEASDVDNLLKIDIICHKRDVNSLLEIFKSEDMLYVSRAIKRSTWLITEPQYAHIINPEYLHTEILPHMMTKAFNKLLSHIKLNLKDEVRIEKFYEYIASKNAVRALSWLPYCSVTFIENVVKTPIEISFPLLARLCEKSFTILQAYFENRDRWEIASALNATKLLLTNYIEEYLDAVEAHPQFVSYLSFGKKYTKLVMTKYPKRIIDKFEVYANCLDTKTFVKYIDEESVQKFLLKYSKTEELTYFFTFNRLEEFIMRISVKDRFDFVKQHCIDSINKDKTNSDNGDLAIIPRHVIESTKLYEWYKFAPFDIAFGDLKKLIRAESSPYERRAMLNVLIGCAGHKKDHVFMLLQYLKEKHINEPLKFKNELMEYLIQRIDTHTLDKASWDLLNILFHSMDLYNKESTDNVQLFIRAIILYHILHDERIPEVIEHKFMFDTYKEIQNKLAQQEKEILFKYLFNYAFNNIKNISLDKKSDLKSLTESLAQVLQLLKDWDKELSDFPLVVDKIKETTNKNRDKGWNIDLSHIYNTKKSWRRILFDVSVLLCPSELVCLNALKHDPTLLTLYKHEVDELCCNNDVSLQRFLSKLRIYWRGSLADEWTADYMARIEKSGGHEALITGLFTLLHQKRQLDIINKYAPQESKINWGEEDELILSLRKQIALKMHIARPLVPHDAVLLYTKGDYLQYAVPSLNAVLYNISSSNIRQNIARLLDAPVSMQKYGIRYACAKLEAKELINILKEVWASTKNLTTRNIVFTLSYDLLCKEKHPSVATDLAALICEFIDNLSPEENKNIYKKMICIESVPIHVKHQIFQKSYVFVHSLPPSADNEQYWKELLAYAPRIIDTLDPSFVASEFLKDMVNDFKTTKSNYIEILVAFILKTTDVETQMRRYEEFLVPLLKLLIASPELSQNKTFVDNFETMLKKLLKMISNNTQGFDLLTKYVIPTKLCTNIRQNLELIMSTKSQYYVNLSCWKLLTNYMNILDANLNVKDSDTWNDFVLMTAPHVANMCITHLKEDIEKYFPSIYLAFSKALNIFFNNLLSIDEAIIYTILKHMLRDESIHTYLLVYSLLPFHTPYRGDLKAILAEIRNILYSHPSLELKFHYHIKFSEAGELQ